MKKITKFIVLFLLPSSVFFLPSVYAGRDDVGTSGAQFLKINAGARPAAMGEAFGGIADDVNALFYNPAGTSYLEKTEFTAQYGSWFQGISYNMLGFAYPVEGVGSFGIAVINLGVNDIEKRSADTENPEGKFGANDSAYILHYSRAVMEKLSAGVNIKAISQRIDENSASAFAGDMGVLWATPVERLTAGLVVQNVGTEIKFITEGDPLPMNIKAGFGYKLPVGEVQMLTAGLDFNMPRDNDMMISGGAEFKRTFKADLNAAVRAGYKTVSQEKLGGLSGLTCGAGIGWKEFGLDFAWVPYGDLGETYRYSLVAKF
ncbi:MAG: PorV/PorQ family protein [Elusimicrobiota bacterium]